VVCANGTAVVSAFGISVTAETGNGTKNDIGMTWRVKRQPSLPAQSQLENVMRIGLLDADPAATNAATLYNVGEFNAWAPSDFQAKYQAERLQTGGFDITARCTPLDTISRDTSIYDLQARLGRSNRVDVLAGKNTITVYDFQLIQPPASIAAKVAQSVGAGGDTTTDHPTLPSIPPGTPVPGHLGSLLPIRITPGKASSSSIGSKSHAQTPDQVAAGVASKQQSTAKARNILGMVRR